MQKLLQTSTICDNFGLNSLINNPEEANKAQVCVNTEDTSSGSAATHNKVTASTTE